MGKFLLSTLLLLTTAFASTAAETIAFSVPTKGDTSNWPGNSSYKNNKEVVSKDGNWVSYNFNTQNVDPIRCGTSAAVTAYIRSNVALDKSISQIKLTFKKYASVSSVGLYISDSATFSGEKIAPSNTPSLNDGCVFNIPSPAPNQYYKIVFDMAKGSNGNMQLSSCEFYANEDQGPVFPTECAAPVFKINGIETTETEVTAYAGTQISVSCATSGAETVWTVNETSISGNEYTIPVDAKVGDVYSFRAQSHVQGESSMIESPVADLTITIATLPLEGYFYSPSVTTAPVYATKLMNKSGEVGGNNNTATKALCAVEGGFNSNLANITFSDTDGSNFAYINRDNTLSIYKGNVFTISVVEGYYITSIIMDKSNANLSADAGVFTDGSWTNAGEETKSSVKFTYNGSSNWTSGCISTIIVKYALLPVVEPEAPADPEFAEEHTEIVDGTLTSEKSEYWVKFKKVEGVDIYYRHILKNNNPTTRAEAVENSDFKKVEEADYVNGIKVTKDHSALEYYAYANGVPSATKTLNIMLDTPTGVAEIEAAGAGEVRWFDMQGREVKGQPEKGIYVRVVNGKASKVIL